MAIFSILWVIGPQVTYSIIGLISEPVVALWLTINPAPDVIKKELAEYDSTPP